MNLRKQSGMTLIEVLVSLVILSFGILGMVGLQSRASALGGDSEDRTRASLLAGELAGAMQAYGSTDVTSGALQTFYTAWTAQLTSGGSTSNASVVGLPPTATATVTASAVGPGTGTTITITWTSPASSAVRQYVTTVSLK